MKLLICKFVFLLQIFIAGNIYAQSTEVLADINDPMFLPVLNEELRKRDDGSIDNSNNITKNIENITENTEAISSLDNRITVLEDVGEAAPGAPGAPGDPGTPAFISGFFTLAAATTATKAHGLASAPTRVTLTIRGETTVGTPDGGNPTLTTVNKLDTNDNGLSVDWDGTNLYISWLTWAARLRFTGGGTENVDKNIEINIFAFDI